MIDLTAAEAGAVLEDGTSVHWKRGDKPQRRTRVYVDTSNGDGTIDIFEDLTNRTRRPYKIWQLRVVDVLARLGFVTGKLRWSQYAGCSCPCSPGFIIEGGDEALAYGGDMWISFENVKRVDETKSPREIAIDPGVITGLAIVTKIPFCACNLERTNGQHDATCELNGENR